jgi:hypothetical protein
MHPARTCTVCDPTAAGTHVTTNDPPSPEPHNPRTVNRNGVKEGENKDMEERMRETKHENKDAKRKWESCKKIAIETES